MPNCYKFCTIKSYKGMSHLKQLATSNELLKKIFAQIKADTSLKNDDEDIGLRFDMVKLCFNENWDINLVKTQLKALEWEFKAYSNPKAASAAGGGGYVKTGNKIEFYDLSFHVKHDCFFINDFDKKVDEIFDVIWTRVNQQQKLAHLNFKSLYKILSQSSFSTIDSLINDFEFNKKQILVKNNSEIKALVDSYFINDFDLSEFCLNFKFDHELSVISFLQDRQKDVLIKNIRKFLTLFQTEMKVTGRLIAKIFHGIASPKCPSEIWARNRQFWRCNLDFDFDYVIQVATHELVNY
jgi:ATP-dependent DNA helicase Q4